MPGASEHPATGRARRTLFRLAAVLFATLLTLLVAELAVRVAGLDGAVRSHFKPGLYQPDAELVWTLQPGYRGYRMEELVQSPTSTNPQGFRGPPWDEARLGAELRILVLGDSCTFGMGVADGDSFPAQLEAELRGRGIPAAVFNAGVPGYGTEQEANLLERLAPVIQPHVVLVAWLPNDAQPRDLESVQILDGYMVEDVERYTKWRNQIDKQGIAGSALYRFIRVRTRMLRDRFGGRRTEWLVKVDPDAFRSVSEAVLRIQSTAASVGAETLLALLPRRDQIEGVLSAPALARMEEFARAQGIRVVPLLEDWRGTIDTDDYFLQDNVHLTAMGYGEMAKRIADAGDFARLQAE
jgi:lysophospholipase L1-like esterase